MAQTFTKTMARNIFYGGSVFFFLLFLALTFDTIMALPERDRREVLDPSTELGRQIAHGKDLWETNNCIGCHSLMPQFNFAADELEAIAQFLKYSSEINTAGWPPNKQG